MWVPTLQIGQPVPLDVRLTDETGRARNWTSFRGDALVVGFIYTRCPDSTECPAVSAKFAEMQTRLPAHTHLIEITIDPSHDTPIVLRRYGELFDQDPVRWTMLTGDPNTVLTLARRFGISVSHRANGEIVHTEAVAVLDPAERLQSLTAGTSWQPREVLAEASALNGEPNDVLARAALAFRNFGTRCGALLNALDTRSRVLSITTTTAAVLIIAGTAAALLRQLRF